MYRILLLLVMGSFVSVGSSGSCGDSNSLDTAAFLIVADSVANSLGLATPVIDSDLDDWYPGVIAFRTYVPGFHVYQYSYILVTCDGRGVVVKEGESSVYEQFIEGRPIMAKGEFSQTTNKIWDDWTRGYIRYVLGISSDELINAFNIDSIRDSLGVKCVHLPEIAPLYSWANDSPPGWRFFTLTRGQVIAHYVEHSRNFGFRHSRVPMN